jgi:hypothetical protein
MLLRMLASALLNFKAYSFNAASVRRASHDKTCPTIAAKLQYQCCHQAPPATESNSYIASDLMAFLWRGFRQYLLIAPPVIE